MLEREQYHDSIRGWFAGELHRWMEVSPDLIVVSGDLGFGMWDQVRKDFPNQFINVGAAELAGMGIAVGLAEEKKVPIFYSITTFALSRPFEVIRNYIAHENIPVKIIGSGRDFDYEHDGWSHHSPDAKAILDVFPNIKQYWPNTKEEIPMMVDDLLNNGKPSFVSLKR